MGKLKDRPIEKRYFKINEVSKVIGVPTSTIRYWEGEFEQIRPDRLKQSRNGHRIYTRKDLMLIKYLKELIHEEGYTHFGARKRMIRDIKNHGSLKVMLEKEVCYE